MGKLLLPNKINIIKHLHLLNLLKCVIKCKIFCLEYLQTFVINVHNTKNYSNNNFYFFLYTKAFGQKKILSLITANVLYINPHLLD